MSAASELLDFLLKDERVEGIVFGGWGGWNPSQGQPWKLSASEPAKSEYEGVPPSPPVPFALRGKVLKWEEAEPLMQDWCFYGGYGSPGCYAVYIWTDRRVIWVTQYDGSTWLDSAPRNPMDCIPDMPGG